MAPVKQMLGTTSNDGSWWLWKGFNFRALAEVGSLLSVLTHLLPTCAPWALLPNGAPLPSLAMGSFGTYFRNSETISTVPKTSSGQPESPCLSVSDCSPFLLLQKGCSQCFPYPGLVSDCLGYKWHRSLVSESTFYGD